MLCILGTNVTVFAEQSERDACRGQQTGRGLVSGHMGHSSAINLVNLNVKEVLEGLKMECDPMNPNTLVVTNPSE